MTDKEALKLALEALQGLPASAWTPETAERNLIAITALKEALAQQEQKRPQNCGTGYCSCIECVVDTPPAAQRKPLADAYLYLESLVEALDGAFISTWQSTAAWQTQLNEAREYLAANGIGGES